MADGPSKTELARRIEALDQRIAAQHPGTTGGAAGGASERMCAMPAPAPRPVSADLDPFQAELIRYTSVKWVNGTKIHYYFWPSGPNAASAPERAMVRDGFKAWKDLGIGLEFEEVNNIDQSEVRISFFRDGRYWSKLGTTVLTVPQHDPTMGFGSDITQDSRTVDVAIHEIGHTLGFPHEHQNPFSDLVWDDAAVLAAFALPPNEWDEATIRRNILNPIPQSLVTGSEWDPDSIMHYAFGAGLIEAPPEYRNGLQPEPGLSPADIKQVKFFYPPIGDPEELLVPFVSKQLDLEPGQQKNYRIEPTASRTYSMATFGWSDAVMVLFEDVDGEYVFVAGDDDSGLDRNARLDVRLYAGRRYVLRVRLYSQWAAGNLAVMLW